MAYRPDEHDLLSAIWVMACNDENPIITFEGLRYRLSLDNNFNVEGLVDSRPELFRHGVSADRLDEWKTEMLNGRHLPSWIRVKGNEEEQREAIRRLTVNDVFRSQFRAKRGAEPSSIEIIELGLEHLDRLRKASLEKRDASVKGTQLTWAIILGVIGIIAQIVIAAIKSSADK